MKFPHPIRFVLLAVLSIGLLIAGLDHIGAHFGPEYAALAGIGLLTLGLTPVTYSLGAVAAAPRNTDTRPGDIVSLPVAAATVIYSGTLVARDAAGRVVAASDTAGLRVIGRAEETIDNSSGGAGDVNVCVRIGCFKFDNSATNAVDADDIGKMAVVEDNQTVAETSANKVSAGRITGVETDGVWVDTRFAFYGPRTVPTLASVDGIMAAAADDAATKAEGEKIGDDVRALHSSFFG